MAIARRSSVHTRESDLARIHRSPLASHPRWRSSPALPLCARTSDHGLQSARARRPAGAKRIPAGSPSHGAEADDFRPCRHHVTRGQDSGSPPWWVEHDEGHRGELPLAAQPPGGNLSGLEPSRLQEFAQWGTGLFRRGPRTRPPPRRTPDSRSAGCALIGGSGVSPAFPYAALVPVGDFSTRAMKAT